MKKKVIIVVSIIVIAIIAGVIFVTNYFALPAVWQRQIKAQIQLQQNSPATPYKLPLDAFTSVLSESRYEELDSWLPDADLASIQNAVLRGSLTLEELTAFYGERIIQMDEYYNSVLRLSPVVMDEARRADAELQRGGDVQELTGLVVLVKDNIAVKGMNTSTGSYALADVSTSRNAFLIQTLIDKGALILGKANLSEFSNFMSQPSANGFSTLGGQTRNAYGDYDVGGSSSGSSVSVALGFAGIALGTETAGSLIYPAGQNSVVGIKPTVGLLSRDLIIPISEAQDTAGIIGRSVADVYRVFRAALQRDSADPLSTVYDTIDPASFTAELDPLYLKGKRLGMFRLPIFEEEFDSIKQDLISLGAEVVDVSFPASAGEINMIDVLLYGIKNDLNTFLSHPAVSATHNSLEKIVAFLQEDESRVPYGQYFLEQGSTGTISREDYETAVANNRKNTGEAIDTVLQSQNLDALVSISNLMSGIYAPALYPAITVPSGYHESGEPYGATFVSSFAEDLALFQIAYSYEQGTGHRVAPPRK